MDKITRLLIKNTTSPLHEIQDCVNVIVEITKEIKVHQNVETVQLDSLVEIIDNFISHDNLLPDEQKSIMVIDYLSICGCKKIPDFVGKLHLNSLDLSRVTTIPDFISSMSNLQCLTLRDCNLTVIPQCIASLDLTCLNVADNELVNLPSFLQKMVNLTSLSTNRNQIVSLPKFIGNLSKLKNIDVSDNKLTALPQSLKKLIQLERLYVWNSSSYSRHHYYSYENLDLDSINLLLAENRVKETRCKVNNPTISSTMTTLEEIKSVLNVFASVIQSIFNKGLDNIASESSYMLLNDLLAWTNAWIDSEHDLSEKTITGVKELNLSGKISIAVPSFLGKMKSLTKLDLSSNNLQEFPAVIFSLNKLKELNLSRNKIKNIPVEITALKDLTKLDLFYNYITELPDYISDLKQLTHLRLERNKLRKLPNSIRTMIKLETLDVRQNRLRKLPRKFDRLTNLTALLLSANGFRDLPRLIGNLKNLVQLNLCNNHLTQYPPMIDSLPNLKILHISGNRFKEADADNV